ncbi:hypothetical protein Tco_1534842, partial [Tanacetum coccineum]
NGYVKNEQKQSQMGQKRARDWKSMRKSKSKAYTSLMGQPLLERIHDTSDITTLPRWESRVSPLAIDAWKRSNG